MKKSLRETNKYITKKSLVRSIITSTAIEGVKLKPNEIKKIVDF